MPHTYIHYFGKESSRSLLEAKGIAKKRNDNSNSSVLKPRQYPHCSEPNRPGSRFCSNCTMVLDYNSYIETVEEQRQKEVRTSNLEIEVQTIRQNQRSY